MKAREIIEEQGTTILDIVNEIFEKTDLACPIKEEVKGEKVIGELTDYEKAMFLALDSYDRISSDFLEQVIKEGGPDLAPGFKEDLQLTLIIEKALRGLFWASLRKRLGVITMQDNGGISVRSGWKVVLVKGEKSDRESGLTGIEIIISL